MHIKGAGPNRQAFTQTLNSRKKMKLPLSFSYSATFLETFSGHGLSVFESVPADGRSVPLIFAHLS